MIETKTYTIYEDFWSDDSYRPKLQFKNKVQNRMKLVTVLLTLF